MKRDQIFIVLIVICLTCASSAAIGSDLTGGNLTGNSASAKNLYVGGQGISKLNQDSRWFTRNREIDNKVNRAYEQRFKRLWKQSSSFSVVNRYVGGEGLKKIKTTPRPIAKKDKGDELKNPFEGLFE
jgi:hypothetical protein